MEFQRPSWVEYFMFLAVGASMRSKDSKTRVGCVIVDSKTLKILSMGYNGFPPGTPNSGENWSDEQKNNLVVHAEANGVLLRGTNDLKNATAFVTLFPCKECAIMLIQAGVGKVYYLSFRDKYRESEVVFKQAKVELVPINRDGDCTLTMFQNRFTNMFKAAIQNVSNMEIDGSANELYQRLKEETKEIREKDIEGPWSRDIQPGERSDQILFKKWTDYYLFLAHVASTRSSSDAKEGALLVDSETFKICSLSYKGYPRGVEETPDEWMMVSAITNVLALRFSEGNKFHAFCTNFPKEGEVKNLAQAKVKRLHFISPTNMTAEALSTLKVAGVEAVPMDPLNEKDIEEETKNTFEGLASKEGRNTTLFKNWPKIQWTPYELEPKRRNSGLEGETTSKRVTIGIAIGIAIGIGIGIGFGIGVSR